MKSVMPKRKPMEKKLQEANKFLSECQAKLVCIRMIDGRARIIWKPPHVPIEPIIEGIQKYERYIAWFSKFSYQDVARIKEEMEKSLLEIGVHPDPANIFDTFVEGALRDQDMLAYRDKVRRWMWNRRHQARLRGEVDDITSTGVVRSVEEVTQAVDAVHSTGSTECGEVGEAIYGAHAS